MGRSRPPGDAGPPEAEDRKRKLEQEELERASQTQRDPRLRDKLFRVGSSVRLPNGHWAHGQPHG